MFVLPTPTQRLLNKMNKKKVTYRPVHSTPVITMPICRILRAVVYKSKISPQTCANRCDRLQSYVQCSVFHTGTYDSEEVKQSCIDQANGLLSIDVVADLDESWFAAEGNTLCTFVDTDGCRARFTYSGSDPIDVTVDKIKVCGGYTSGFRLADFLGWMWAKFMEVMSKPCIRD